MQHVYGISSGICKINGSAFIEYLNVDLSKQNDV